MSDQIMAWSSDFTGEIPRLNLPVGGTVVSFEPEEAAVAHHLLSEFLRDCAVHRRAPDYRPAQPAQDWGHGPKTPVKTYTEAQIREAFLGAGERASDQLIETLRKDRERNRQNPSQAN